MALGADSTDRDGGCHGGRHSRLPMVFGFNMINGKKRVFWRQVRLLVSVGARAVLRAG